LLAISFNLMLGYTGMLSFCHAALFATGAYAIGILQIKYDINIILGIICSGIIAALLALIIGFISIRRLGLYFAMLTLAFNEVVYFTIFEMRSITGGDDGLTGIERPNLNIWLTSISIKDTYSFYFFVALVFIISLVIIRRITDTPFGSVLKGIRDNENRAESVGYKARIYKIMVFGVSGFFAGVAGSLFCMQIKYVSLSLSSWTLSGEIIIMALLGGYRSLYGPIIGAALVIIMQDVFSNIWDRWLLLLGVVFVFFVMFAKGGIWEGCERVWNWLSKKNYFLGYQAKDTNSN